MSAMLLLTLTCFSQQSLTAAELQKKYKHYTENTLAIHKLSFDDWKLKNGYSESKQEEGKQIENTQPKVIMVATSPGTYLIKAKSQILDGFGCQFLAGGIAALGTTSSNSRNAVYVGAGALSILGLGLEISGILNIGKAGFSLNENGIGIKVKF